MNIARLLIAVVLVGAGCSRPASEQAPPPTAPPASPEPAATTPQQVQAEVPAIDACTLLTGEEIAEAQGAAVTSTTPSMRSENGLPIAQCYFALPASSDSLSLVVYKAPPGGGRMPKDYWNRMFHVERPAKTGRDGKPKVQPTPEKIEGIADEAFWGGGQFGGTLHVLKGEDVFQLSVGGPGDEAAKRESLKRLATKIAERL